MRTTYVTVCAAAQRRPRRTTALYSAPRVSRFGLASTARDQAESSVRPLRRRAERIARPARVRMRSAETVLLGAATVVGLEGALGHEDHFRIRVPPGRSRPGTGVTKDCPLGISQPIKATAQRPITQTERPGAALCTVTIAGPGPDTRERSTVEFAPDAPA